MNQEIINDIVGKGLTELVKINRETKKFSELLSKHNPYEISIFCNTPEDIVGFVTSSHKQKSKQTIMGYLLESIAVKICKITLNGYKSKQACTDLEWISEGKKHYRGWKSSPNWCNADQKSRVVHKKSEMEKDNDFGSFKVMTSYGKTTKNQTNNRFIQLSGQDAWEEISGDTEMYNKVMMGILSYKQEIYQTIENIYLSDIKMSIEWVTNNFTNEDGTINFIKINKYVSGGIKG